ncbi:cation diffusion facilitator family transporter [Lewinella sp. JB7]|uniref:cation diffusion facilitator family transporter n=1 Tax=Lewinella sp. JB7 TaxID=2962887 RepID=UPI0020C97EAA|nr:cation diffusion facilitator family transporter [Lewinella sp. JB7]MCP9236135.1 cation diffusion facilitator family transporter [Lewinella sp. JB7]
MIYRAHAFELPADLQPRMQRAKRLEWITVAYLISVVGLMYLVMGSSQAMKTAWLEDILGLFPAISFLVAARHYDRPPSASFPYGYHRVYSIAFLTGAVALFAMGAFLLIDAGISLMRAERPTIGSTVVFGQQVWSGWLMILTLLYSALPSVVLGRAKLPLARELHNKILFTDADTQKADYRTAFAAIAGIVGVGMGYWWADSAAAVLISFSVLKDGYGNLKEAVQDLMDRYPQKVEEDRRDPLIGEVHALVASWPWVEESRVRFREDGQVYFGEILVVPRRNDKLLQDIAAGRASVRKLHWKLHDVTIMPVPNLEDVPEESVTP